MTQTEILPTRKLDDLLAEGASIYVRNNQKGIIVITASESNGRSSRIVIPRTKHPFSLSDRATRYSLENSSSLKELLVSGSIDLLEPKGAEKELDGPGVQAELRLAIKRTTNRATEVASYKGNAEHTGISPETPLANEDTEIVAKAIGNFGKAQDALGINPHSEIGEAPENAEDDLGDLSSGVNPRVIGICGLVADGEKPAREAKIELSSMLEDLVNDDLDYIVSHSGGSLQVWAQNALAVRQGKNVPPEVLDVESMEDTNG